MAEQESRGPERRRGRNVRPQSERRLRHFLEDETDRFVERYFGAGRARERSSSRRREQYLAAATRQIEIALQCGFDATPAPSRRLPLESLHCVRVELNAGGSQLTVHFTSNALEAGETLVASTRAGDSAGRALASMLRRMLAVQVPRRRSPDVRVRVLAPDVECEPDGDGELDDDLDSSDALTSSDDSGGSDGSEEASR